jgi:hypothetical protein
VTEPPLSISLFDPVDPDEIEVEIARQEEYVSLCDQAITDIWEDAEEAEAWLSDYYASNGEEEVEDQISRDRTSRALFELAYDRRQHWHEAYIATLYQRLDERTGTEASQRA